MKKNDIRENCFEKSDFCPYDVRRRIGYNSTNVLTNEWLVDITYGIPKANNIEDPLTDVCHSYSMVDNIYTISRPCKGKDMHIRLTLTIDDIKS